MINYTATKQKVADETSSKHKMIMLRMSIVSALCFVGFFIVLSRAFYLHLVDNNQLKWIADKQYNARIPVSIRRGQIFDRNAEELAVSLPVPSIYADPAMIEDRLATAKKLSSVLKIKESELSEKLNTTKHFVWIKRRISHETLEEVKALNIPGVSYTEESRRFYPNGELAAQVLGAVGYDSQALAGLELAFNDFLISQKKAVTYKRDARGKMYASPVSFVEQTDVGSLYLTIDKRIQFITEKALNDAVEKTNAEDGIAIALDPTTGDVLAMATAPAFDPNRYSKYPIENWRNRAVTDSFEPGSTFKVLVVASALDAGTVTPRTTFFCENGAVRIGSNILKDHNPYGKLTVEDIIKVSSNIGAMKVGFALGKEKLFNALRSFGIGSVTGISYPGEVGGIFRNYESWQSVEHATVAFGQGVSVTPLQMATAFATIVNGGIHYRPRLISRLVDRDGNVTNFQSSNILSQPIKKETSDVMREMLRRVVEQGGTGTSAFSKAYSVGGKTGTAQKVDSGKGYAAGKYYSSFIGFAPVESPRIVVYVGIDEPKGSYYGGTVAAPAVKDIIEGALPHMGVPSQTSPVLLADQPISKGVEEVDAKAISDKKPVFKESNDGSFVMPNLVGYTFRDVLMATQNVDVDIRSEGSGIAVRQSPEPGARIEKEKKVSVRFELPR